MSDQRESAAKLRDDYLRSQAGDLATYAAMLGGGFEQRVDLLAQLIRDAHHPSLGAYKERLLRKTIAEHVPGRYRVGTGFVLFPKKRTHGLPPPDSIDHLNLREHEVSRQLDVIVYDSAEYPVIFQDGDFVVLRPEAVRAIVEVKGSLKDSEVVDAADGFLDYAWKWQAYDRLLKSFLGNKLRLPEPRLLVMAWRVYVDPQGRPGTDGQRARECGVAPSETGHPGLDIGRT